MIIGGGDKGKAKATEAQKHENRSRAMLGNQNAKKEFSSLSEEEKKEMKKKSSFAE